jgi:hypothetical protein
MSEEVQHFLTPTKEEQVLLILAGKCPHNAGWEYVGHGHNDDAYECLLCRESKWY